MKLNITTVAGGQTLESSIAVPADAAGAFPAHLVTNAVMQATTAALNGLNQVQAKLEKLTIEVAE